MCNEGAFRNYRNAPLFRVHRASSLADALPLPDNCKRDLSFVRGEAMLPEEDSLPSPEVAAAVHDRNANRSLAERCSNVRRHIIGSFVYMYK